MGHAAGTLEGPSRVVMDARNSDLIARGRLHHDVGVPGVAEALIQGGLIAALAWVWTHAHLVSDGLAGERVLLQGEAARDIRARFSPRNAARGRDVAVGAAQGRRGGRPPLPIRAALSSRGGHLVAGPSLIGTGRRVRTEARRDLTWFRHETLLDGAGVVGVVGSLGPIHARVIWRLIKARQAAAGA